MAKKTLEEIVKEQVAKETAALKNELSNELQKAISASFASAFGEAGGLLGAGAGTLLDSAISGKKVDLRALFNSSNSQLGEQLAAMLSSAQRNF